ncbi:S9 family peptidase, partial [Staphylococcus epidermidis]
MPVESNTHRFEEITYTVDELNVKALQMIPTYHNVKRIVVYL